jgi:hypothetical protein
MPYRATTSAISYIGYFVLFSTPVILIDKPYPALNLSFLIL